LSANRRLSCWASAFIDTFPGMSLSGLPDGRRRLLCGSALVILVFGGLPVFSAPVTHTATSPDGASVHVRVHVDGQTVRGTVHRGSVKAALAELGIEVGPLDRVSPPLTTPVPTRRQIEITRVERKTLKIIKPVPFDREFQYSDELRAGIQKTIRPGTEGKKELTFEVWYKNGKETLRKPVGERLIEPPQNELVLVGARQSFVSRGMPRARKVLVMEATGYSPGPRSCGKYANGWTALGIRAQYGVVAVDPKYIPFGTRLYVEGYGYAIAADTGRAIKGLKIDLCHPTHEKALKVGRKKVRVYLLD